jgi:hypothetical protein
MGEGRAGVGLVTTSGGGGATCGVNVPGGLVTVAAPVDTAAGLPPVAGLRGSASETPVVLPGVVRVIFGIVLPLVSGLQGAFAGSLVSASRSVPVLLLQPGMPVSCPLVNLMPSAAAISAATPSEGLTPFRYASMAS